MIRSAPISRRRLHQPRLCVELLEDRSVPAAGLPPNVGAVAIEPTMVAYNSTALAASVVQSPSDYDGVAKVVVTTQNGQQFGGSGSLLKDNDPSSDYVLTAAHMVTDDSGQLVKSVSLTWPGGVTVSSFEQIFVHPNWTGNPLLGNDLAIIKIPQITSDAVDRYELFRGTGTPELRQVFTKAGYGLPGVGSTGYNPNGGFGTLRIGQNRFDDTYTATSGTPRSDHPMLAYDFDNGRPWNDAIGVLFGIRDLGLGTKEAFAAPGDSGGPSFLNGQIAGVTSFIMSVWLVDVRFGVNSSFGEIGFDTRVSHFTSWIDGVLAGATSSATAASTGGTAPLAGNVLRTLVDTNAPAVWISPEVGRPAPLGAPAPVGARAEGQDPSAEPPATTAERDDAKTTVADDRGESNVRLSDRDEHAPAKGTEEPAFAPSFPDELFVR